MSSPEETLDNAIQAKVTLAYEVMDELANNGFENYDGTPPASFEGDWRLGIPHEEYSEIMEVVGRQLRGMTADEICNFDIRPTLSDFGKDYSSTGFPEAGDLDLEALLGDEARAKISCAEQGIGTKNDRMEMDEEPEPRTPKHVPDMSTCNIEEGCYKA